MTKLLTSYEEHYKMCRELYTGNVDNMRYSSLYDVVVDKALLDLDERYYDVVKKISQKCSKMFDTREGCFEDTHAIRLNDWYQIYELEELARIVMPQLEEKVFHSNLKVEFVHPYRNKIVQCDPRTSWVWHYDDCPKEFIKFFLHLNDVNEDNGCFQYITKHNNITPVIPSARFSPWHRGKQVYANSRIPRHVVDSIINNGGRANSFTGSRGSYAVLTPNIMHRATVPKVGTIPRDIIVFFIRPSLEKDASYILGKADSYKPERNVKQYVLD